MAPQYLRPNVSPHIENFLIDEVPGALITRKGFSKCGDIPSGNTPTGVWKFTSSAGTSSLVVSDSQNFYSTQDCVNYTTIQTGWNANNIPDCEMVYSEIWCVNGTNTPFKWDGSSTVVLGGGGVANVPAGEFIEFEKNIVWIAKTASALSSVFFSNRTDPVTGAIVSPSSSTVWPAANEIRVAQNDGDQVYGMKKYQGTIHVCKSNSIHVLRGDDEFDFSFFRTVDNAGCHNRTMVEFNGLMHFLGRNGIYKYDGNNAVRISDGIKNFTASIRQPLVNSSQREWTTRGDFLAGTLDANIHVSDSDPSKIRLVESDLFDDFADGQFTSSQTWTTTDGGGQSVTDGVLVTSDVYNRMALYAPTIYSTGTWYITFKFNGPSCNTGGRNYDSVFTFMFYAIAVNPYQGYGLVFRCEGYVGVVRYRNGNIYRDSDTGTHRIGGGGVASIGEHRNMYSTQTWRVTRGTDRVIRVYDPSNIKVIDTEGYGDNFNTSFTSITNIAVLGAGYDFSVDDIRRPHALSTGVFTSQAYDTGSSFGSWGLIKIKDEKNSGGLDYFTRVATSALSLNDQSFVQKQDGMQISTRTDARFIQWRSTLTAANGIDSPLLDSFLINWNNTGSRSILPSAGYIDNRYWLSVATESVSSKSAVLVKSKDDDAFTLFTGSAQFNGFAELEGRDYAISSSTDEIYVLNSGNNDNGTSINQIWESRDEDWGIPMNSKNVMEYDLDYLGTQSRPDVRVRRSTDSGNFFTTVSTFSILGSNDRRKKRIYEPSLKAMHLRHRIESNDLDKPVTIYGLDSLAYPMKIRE